MNIFHIYANIYKMPIIIMYMDILIPTPSICLLILYEQRLMYSPTPQPHMVFIVLFISISAWVLTEIPLKGVESEVNGNYLRSGN